MAFQIKDFASILLGMTNRAKATQDKITDFRVGSVVRTLLESPAAEIDELYQQIWLGLKESIPVAVYRGFNFGIIEPTQARGNVTITFGGPLSTAITFPAATVFNSASTGLRYLSNASVAAAIGATSAIIPVTCTTGGSVGNVPANDLSPATLQLPIGAVVTSASIFSGLDEETEAERAARFAEYIQSLSRGTESAVRYAVKQARVLSPSGAVDEYVERVGFAESGGRVWLYLYSSAGIPSDELLANGQRIIDGYVDPDTGIVVPGYRAAGIRIDVLPMIERPIASVVQVGMFPGYALDSAVINAMTDVFHSLVRSIESGSILYINDLVERLLTTTGVRRVVIDNEANILCGVSEVLVPSDFEATLIND